MSRLFWICLGGAVGTGARYILAGWVLRLLGPAFPFGTLLINVLGSFAISVVMHLALSAKLIAPTLRLTLATGVLGGFTTYSTFNYETSPIFAKAIGRWASPTRPRPSCSASPRESRDSRSPEGSSEAESHEAQRR